VDEESSGSANGEEGDTAGESGDLLEKIADGINKLVEKGEESDEGSEEVEQTTEGARRASYFADVFGDQAVSIPSRGGKVGGYTKGIAWRKR
jgi:hypothetical protein